MKNKILVNFNKKVVSISLPKIKLDGVNSAEKLANYELLKKTNPTKIVTSLPEPIKGAKGNKPGVVTESAMIGARVGVPASMAGAVTIGSVTSVASGLAVASPALFGFSFGATLGITGLLNLAGAFIGPFVGMFVGFFVGGVITLMQRLFHRKPNHKTGPVKYEVPAAKQLAFIGAFTGVVSGAVQGGMIGSAGGPFFIFLGIVLGGLIGGIMGYVGGYAGGKLLAFIFNKINSRNLANYLKKQGINKGEITKEKEEEKKKLLLVNPENGKQPSVVETNKELVQAKISNLKKMIEQRKIATAES